MRKMMLILLVVLALSAMVALVAAAANELAAYAIPWWTVDGGGGTSQGGNYTLSGTAGQPDTASSSGGAYSVNSGFWTFAVKPFKIYMPLVLR